MSRMIDADALMEAINTWPKFGVDERCRIVPWSERYEPYIHLRDAVIAITGMPTIEERKTGQWIIKKDFRIVDGYDWKCDQCGSYQRYTSNYCPHCGADMRGEQHEAD